MKPTPEQLRIALAEAERLREAGEDARFLTKTLRYQQERLRHLERVLAHAERLVKFGLDEHEHALLIKALDEAKRAEAAAGKGEGGWGLAAGDWAEATLTFSGAARMLRAILRPFRGAPRLERSEVMYADL